MKKIISILLIICLLVAFSSCTISKNKEPTNPYQVTEKRTQIKENFDVPNIILDVEYVEGISGRNC